MGENSASRWLVSEVKCGEGDFYRLRIRFTRTFALQLVKAFRGIAKAPSHHQNSHFNPYCMMREFTLIALIFPNVLGVETSLAGIGKIGVIEDVEDLPAENHASLFPECCALDESHVEVALVRPSKNIPSSISKDRPAASNWKLSIDQTPSGMNGAGTNTVLLKNWSTRLLTLPLRRASFSVARPPNSRS